MPPVPRAPSHMLHLHSQHKVTCRLGSIYLKGEQRKTREIQIKDLQDRGGLIVPSKGSQGESVGASVEVLGQRSADIPEALAQLHLRLAGPGGQG